MASAENLNKDNSAIRHIEPFVLGRVFADLNNYLLAEMKEKSFPFKNVTPINFNEEEWMSYQQKAYEFFSLKVLGAMVFKYMKMQMTPLPTPEEECHYDSLECVDFITEELKNLDNRITSKEKRYVIANTDVGTDYFKKGAYEDVIALSDAFDKAIRKQIARKEIEVCKGEDHYTDPEWYKGALKAACTVKRFSESAIRHECKSKEVPRYDVDYSPV